MERISELEKRYVLEALDNEFETSKNSNFNNRLESAFCERLHSKYAIGHCNGTATLHVALMACDVGPGDEVIVPALTMSSTSIPVVLCGAIPVFADSDLKRRCRATILKELTISAIETMIESRGGSIL